MEDRLDLRGWTVHPRVVVDTVDIHTAAYVLAPDGTRYDLSREDVETLETVGIEWLPELMAVVAG